MLPVCEASSATCPVEAQAGWAGEKALGGTGLQGWSGSGSSPPLRPSPSPSSSVKKTSVSRVSSFLKACRKGIPYSSVVSPPPPRSPCSTRTRLSQNRCTGILVGMLLERFILVHQTSIHVNIWSGSKGQRKVNFHGLVLKLRRVTLNMLGFSKEIAVGYLYVCTERERQIAFREFVKAHKSFRVGQWAEDTEKSCISRSESLLGESPSQGTTTFF